MKNDPYKKAGVDIKTGNDLVDKIRKDVASTFDKNVLGGIGGFSGFYSLPKGFKNPVLVACTDGVGTKVALAQKNSSLGTIGQDLVAMCVNDMVTSGAHPLFFLDYFASSKLNVTETATVIKSIAKACKKTNCSLIGGETAEMPNHYIGKNFDLAGFSVGIVEKKLIIDSSRVKKNNIIIGIESSGAHSNGYSLINKLIKESKLSKSEKVKLIKLALKPTHLYTNVVLDLLKKVKVKSIANITGGGLTENIPRSIPKTLSSEIYLSNWKMPALFSTLQKLGKIQIRDMLRIFNCGIGMTLVIEPKDFNTTMKVLSKHKFKGFMIGKVVNKSSSEITFL
ncbi:phosphoribosylformylglycinamidine cyclo-ligase [Pseudomonadota bacterium]|nr:phosphoribosylformylglycinamidine cyclo-ligase [Pseudomonadota bacterium]